MQGIFFEGTIEENYLGHIMAEVYKDRVYAPFLEGKQDLTILDIGANVGLTSHYFSKFAKQVYAVEPSVEHFGCLSMMIDFNKLTNIKPINKAIYIKSGELPLFHNKNKTMYSLHMAVRDPSLKEEMVNCVTFVDLFKDEGIEHVDFMKLDVEGSEVEILSSRSFKDVADKIDLIIGELHGWTGRHPNQINEALKSAGFKVENIPSDANIFVAKK